MTTLDDVIAEYGVPGFCKIDVEGYESNVLEALSKRIPYISFEYCHEFLVDSVRCLDYLERLGVIQLNYAPIFDFTRLRIKLGPTARRYYWLKLVSHP